MVFVPWLIIWSHLYRRPYLPKTYMTRANIQPCRKVWHDIDLRKAVKAYDMVTCNVGANHQQIAAQCSIR